MSGEIPSYAPKPGNDDVDLQMFVHINHARDKLTRHSRTGTGFVIKMNTALIDALSKSMLCYS